MTMSSNYAATAAAASKRRTGPSGPGPRRMVTRSVKSPPAVPPPAGAAAAAAVSATGGSVANLPPFRAPPVPPPEPDPFETQDSATERSVRFVDRDNDDDDDEESSKPAARNPAPRNQAPSITGPFEEACQECWEQYVSMLEPHESAFGVAQAEWDTTWQQVGAQLTQPPTPSDPKNILRHWVSDNANRTYYYLMVVNNKISVVSGFATSAAGSSPYDRVYFLVNDHTQRASTGRGVRPPKIDVFPGQCRPAIQTSATAEGILVARKIT